MVTSTFLENEVNTSHGNIEKHAQNKLKMRVKTSSTNNRNQCYHVTMMCTYPPVILKKPEKKTEVTPLSSGNIGNIARVINFGFGSFIVNI